VDRVFLDANVLFSASYKPSKLIKLWEMPNIQLITSEYALEEAYRNLEIIRKESLPTLEFLVKTLEISKEVIDKSLNLYSDIKIVDKDKPIIVSAIFSKATHLLTGDKKHFGDILGKKIRGVLILTPSDYMQSKK
jgi:uncharacterized protein